jgi:hypothetical protein
MHEWCVCVCVGGGLVLYSSNLYNEGRGRKRVGKSGEEESGRMGEELFLSWGGGGS